MTLIGKHRITRKAVCVKVIPKNVIKTSNSPELTEIAMLQALESRHLTGIQKFVEAIEEDTNIYLVTQLMNAGDLQSALQSSSCPYICEEKLLKPLRSILEALATIHSLGYIHNDIQPNSILLHCESDKTYRAVFSTLSSCSRATATSQDAGPSLVNDFSCMYAAPEIIDSNGKSRSHANDVWSLGVLLYAVACGRMPFANLE